MYLRYALFILLLLTSCEKEAPKEIARPVKAIQVQESSLSSNQVIFPGTLRAFKRANLSFRVDGEVVKRDIAVGQKVKKNEVLIQIDPRDYEIALKKAKGTVDSTKAQLDFASRDYDRMKNIYDTDPGAISQSYLDRKLENTNKLKGELIVAEGDLEKATDDLAYSTLKAPFDGIITAIYVENHEQVRAKQTALRLIDITNTELEINVPEKYINTILESGKENKFQVIIDTFPDKIFPAMVSEIASEASSTTQTYPVTLTIQGIPFEESLLSGMSGKAILQLPVSSKGTQTAMFRVPLSAVMTDSLGHSSVWMINPKEKTVHKKEVKILEGNNENNALISEGLTAGDWVVVAGTSFLSEGQKVIINSEPSGP